MYSAYDFYKDSKFNSLYFWIYRIPSRDLGVPREIMSLSFYIAEMLPRNKDDRTILAQTRLQVNGNKIHYKSRFIDEIFESLKETSEK